MKAVNFCRGSGVVVRQLLWVLMMVCGGVSYSHGAMEDSAASPEAGDVAKVSNVVKKSPVVQSMPTQMMDKALVQDLVRVGEKIFLVGERGHIGWSEDNGATWTQATVPTIQDINAIFFITADIGWAVGHDGNIFSTIDAGRTWTLQLDGLAFNLVRAEARKERFSAELEKDQAELDELQAQLDEAQAAEKPKQKLIDELQEKVDTLDDAIYELDFQVRDAGKTLEEENAPWPLMDVWFSDVNTGYAVGAFNAFLMTHDGGKNWEDVSGRLDNPDGLHLNAVSGIDSTVFIVGEAGLIFRSTDAGETWQQLESPDEGSFFTLYVAKQADSSDLKLMVAGLEGAIFSSVDNGDTWEQVPNPLNYNLNSIYAGDNNLMLIVGNDGAILRSVDGGLSFKPYRQTNQVTLSSVVQAANGDYLLGGASGVQILKPDQLVPYE